MTAKWYEVPNVQWVVFVVAVLLPVVEAMSRPQQHVLLVSSATSPKQIVGQVSDPNGQPVAGACVALAAQYHWLTLRNGLLRRGEDGPEDAPKTQMVETDPNGRFCFEGEWSDPFYLFATHATGFGAMTGKEYRKSHEMRLQRWGRVEGQLEKGRIGTDHRVWMVGLPNPTWVESQCELQYDTPCDANGRFVFERVPAGWCDVGYLLATGDDSEGFTSRTPVLVKAGETSHMKIGGEGRSVIGRFVPPVSYGRPVYFGRGTRALCRNEKIEHDDMEAWRLFEQQPKGDPYGAHVFVVDPRTKDYVIESNNGQREWYSPWHRTREAYIVGDAIWSDMDWRGYAFHIGKDGAFRIEGVVPGRYDLLVDLEERNIPVDSVEIPFAEYRGTIEVPSTAELHTDQSFNVGSLTLNVFGVGDSAPVFQGKTIDGKPIRLIDYRGKFVLVSFSSAEDSHTGLLNDIKKLHDIYGDRGDFQILSHIRAMSMKEVERYAAKHQIEWPVIYANEMFPDDTARQWHLASLPSAVLVDPEGKIIAAHLQMNRLAETVRGVLQTIGETGDGNRGQSVRHEGV